MQYREGTLIISCSFEAHDDAPFFQGSLHYQLEQCTVFCGKSRKANIDLHSLILPQYG